jgi:hypothetical protein
MEQRSWRRAAASSPFRQQMPEPEHSGLRSLSWAGMTRYWSFLPTITRSWRRARPVWTESGNSLASWHCTLGWSVLHPPAKPGSFPRESGASRGWSRAQGGYRASRPQAGAAQAEGHFSRVNAPWPTDIYRNYGRVRYTNPGEVGIRTPAGPGGCRVVGWGGVGLAALSTFVFSVLIGTSGTIPSRADHSDERASPAVRATYDRPLCHG